MPSLAYPSPDLAAPRFSETAQQPASAKRDRHRLKIAPLSFTAAPALLAACSFATGILATHYFSHPPFLLLLMMLCAATLAATASWRAFRVVPVPLGCVWLILGVICATIEPSPDPQTALIAEAGKATHVYEGQVTRIGPTRLEETSAPFSNKVEEEYSQQLDISVEQASVEAVAPPRGRRKKSQALADTPDRGLMMPLAGGIRATLYSPAAAQLPTLNCGTAVRLTMSVHQPDLFRDTGVWDARAYMLSEGIAAVGSAKVSELTIIAGQSRPLSRSADFHCRLHAIQQAASNRLMAFAASQNPREPALLRLSHDDAAMLSAMVAGDRTWLNRTIRIGFERTGSFHLLVVSGMHLAIFAGLVFWAARRLHLPRGMTTVVTIALAFAYALCTGFGQPVQRSFWMVTLFLIARLLWRERNSLNAIGFAALCLLAANPRALFDAGFQMTLLSVIAVAGIAAPVAERTFAPYLRAVKSLSQAELDGEFPPRLAQFRIGLRMIAEHLTPLLGSRLARILAPACLHVTLRAAELLLVSATIELVMSLPMAVYFHRITVLALPVNFLIVPFIGLLLPAALLTFVVLLCSKALAIIPAALTAVLLHMIVGFIQHFGSLSAADLRIPSPANWATGGFILLLATSVWAVRRIGVTVGALALVAAAAVAIAPRPITHSHTALEIIAIDVGQGDSLLVITPDGKTLLIDAGGSPFGPPPGTSNFEIGEDVVSPVLWSRGIRRLDAVALTHGHADHMGGMPAVFANFRPREFWIGHNPHSKLYDALLAEAAHLNTAVEPHVAGDRFAFGAILVEVLAPESNYQPGPVASNEDSLVMRLVYGKTSALMEGDAEAPSEERMLDEMRKGMQEATQSSRAEPLVSELPAQTKHLPNASSDSNGTLRSDLLKVGHHGSRTSTNPDFLAAVAPTYAVISVGRRNFYGHPRHEVLDELQEGHVHTYRTDMAGAEEFFLDGTHVSAASALGP